MSVIVFLIPALVRRDPAIVGSFDSFYMRGVLQGGIDDVKGAHDIE